MAMNRSRRVRWLASAPVLAAISLSASAQTATPPPTKSEDVVVVGRDKRERDKQVRAFVSDLTAPSGSHALPRFNRERLCPNVIGLPDSYDAAIAARIRRVATAAKVDVAAADCHDPNALVIFTDDKEAVIAALRKRYPGLFRNEYGDPIVVDKAKDPVAAWHVKSLVTGDGAAVTPTAKISNTIAGPSFRIKAAARPVYMMSVIVIPLAAIDGLTAMQIGDYAAMRTLTDATPASARKAGAPSILTVIDTAMDAETPLSMTNWDFTFLRGFYATPVDALPGAQRGAIGTYMKHSLDRAAPAAP